MRGVIGLRHRDLSMPCLHSFIPAPPFSRLPDIRCLQARLDQSTGPRPEPPPFHGARTFVVVVGDHHQQLSILSGEHIVYAADYYVVLVVDVGADELADPHVAPVGQQRIALRWRNAGRIDSRGANLRATCRRLRRECGGGRVADLVPSR